MDRSAPYTAAYAEMARHVVAGTEAIRLRQTEAALAALSRAVEVAAAAGLGPTAEGGARLNLALAYLTAGRLAEAEALYRSLLATPDLPPELRVRARHGLGTALALQGLDGAEAALSTALAEYDNEVDALICAMDLAEFRLRHGDPALAYRELAAAVERLGAAVPQERACQAQLLLARLALASGDWPGADGHLAAAAPLLPPAPDHILHSLCQAVTALRAWAAGDRQGALRQAQRALEAALARADGHGGEVLHAVAEIFCQVARAGGP